MDDQEDLDDAIHGFRVSVEFSIEYNLPPRLRALGPFHGTKQLSNLQIISLLLREIIVDRQF